MISVGIVGSTGLVGEGLIRVLLGHPEATLTFLGSRHAAGQPVNEALPSLKGALDMVCEEPTADRMAES